LEEKISRALVIIDPQNDFCDRGGSLYVDGAEEDVARLSRHISRFGERYGGVYVSLDSHDPAAIFHPKFWLDESGARPAPFTSITGGDLASGRFKPARSSHVPVAEKLFRAMGEKCVPSLVIWPEHCVVSTWGHGIAEPLRAALDGWRDKTGLPVRYVFKGENPYTEQFSIFEGIDESWPGTAFNGALCSELSGFDEVTFAGEALSHCVEASVRAYVLRGGDAVARQMKYFLADCASPVAGFDRAASERALASLGVVPARSEE
jgi:nicotinamidase-related amidase